MDDIWKEFEKIAVAQGLISIADEDKQPKTKTRNSLSDDAVRLLYNIEPEPEKKKSIIELAHPETATVGRAYDAMNSVVENVQQRQDMMAYIALKMPNGNLTQRRYVAAKKDLLDSLIRSAFTLDHQEEEGLMTLADSCAQRLEERKFQKEAIAPAVVGIGAAAVAMIGLGYYFFKGAPPAENVYQNASKVIAAIGPAYDSSNNKNLMPIKQDMTKLMDMAKAVYAAKSQLAPIHSVDEAITSAQQELESRKAYEAHKILASYLNQLEKVKKAMPSWISAIRVGAGEDTESRGDWSAKFHALTNSVINTPEEDLIEALEGKSDLFAKLKQFIPGTGQDTHGTGGAAVSGGLLGAIDQEIVKFEGAAREAQSKAPEIHRSIENEAVKPQIQSPVSKTNPNLIAEKSPSDSINQDLLSQLG